MDTAGLRSEIAIAGAGHDAGMFRSLAMELDEMLPVEGQDRTPFGGGMSQDIRIADAPLRHPRFLDRHDVMTEESEFFDDGEGEILIREEPGHRSGHLVLADLTVDLIAMTADISPGVRQVFGAERGIAPQQLRFADPQASRLFEHPDRDPRPYDTRFAATDSGPVLDPRRGAAELPHDPLKELCLLGRPQVLQLLLDLVNGVHG
jgi:hypothetical protein